MSAPASVRRPFFLLFAVVAWLAGALSPPSAAAYSLKGCVVKGPLAGGAVRIYSLRGNGGKNARLAAKVTSAGGGFSLKLADAPTVPLLVEVRGGSYREEATGEIVTLLSTDVMTAAVPVGSKTVTVSPLTHLATVRARKLAGSGVPLKTAIAASYAGVARQYGLPDIGRSCPAAADDAAAIQLAPRDARIHGLVLAGLSSEAAAYGVRTADLVKALAEDLSDGSFDGTKGGQGLVIPTPGGGTIPLGANGGTAELQSGIDAFAGSPRNRTALPEHRIPLEPVGVGLNGAGRFYSSVTSLPAWISGRSGAATLGAKGGSPPYHCSLAPGSALPSGFSVSDDCVLAGTAEVLPAGTTLRITPPFTVILRDSGVPPASVDLVLRVTIVAEGPVLRAIPAQVVLGYFASVAVASATGGTPPVFFRLGSSAAGAPPPGMILDTGGHAVGKPAAEGKYPFVVTVVDFVGATADVATSVRVSRNPTIMVQKTGAGEGRVRSNPAGIDCGTDCVGDYPAGRTVVLTATPLAGSVFAGWSAASCSGVGDCVLTMDAFKVVTAEFDPPCASPGFSCDSVSCCGGSCIPNPGCPWVVDVGASMICYGPCAGTDCGNGCCPLGYPTCGANCLCYP